MNIKFSIRKTEDVYNFSILYMDSEFSKFIDSKVLHINHVTKKITRNDRMMLSYIDEYRISFYLSKYNRTCVEYVGGNKMFRINSMINYTSSFKTDVKDFDIKVIKGIKALSDAYNNKKNGNKNSNN